MAAKLCYYRAEDCRVVRGYSLYRLRLQKLPQHKSSHRPVTTLLVHDYRVVCDYSSSKISDPSSFVIRYDDFVQNVSNLSVTSENYASDWLPCIVGCRVDSRVVPGIRNCCNSHYHMSSVNPLAQGSWNCSCGCGRCLWWCWR